MVASTGHDARTFSLQGIVASFIAMGIELEVPSTSYFSSNNAKSTNRRAAKLQNEFRCLSKVTPIHWKDGGDDAEKNRSSHRNLLSFHLHTFTSLTLDGNRDVNYYCFVVALGPKGDIHDIIEIKFNDELEVLAQPKKYYHSIIAAFFFWTLPPAINLPRLMRI
jgi:hypothetical protein